MKCPHCNKELRPVSVSVHGAKSRVSSHQCPTCDYFEFEPVSSRNVIEELRMTPLQMRQKVVKLSQNRVGIYLNNDITRSLGIKGGENIYLSVPDKKHIVVELEA